jgi:acyl-CoA dehydrogenase
MNRWRTEIRGAQLYRDYPDSYWREWRKPNIPGLSSGPDTYRVYGDADSGSTVAPDWASEASVILEIHHSGGNAAACHAQMYIMGTLLRHGSEAHKRRYLPKIADGSLRLQAFRVSEPNTGTDTTQLSWRSKRGPLRDQRAENLDFARNIPDLMLLLARTTPADR